MEREKVKQLLAKIEVQDGVFGVHGNERETAINALSKSVPITWFEQFASLVEQETLERATKAISGFHGSDGDFDSEHDRMYYNRAINDSLNAVWSVKDDKTQS